MRKSFGAKPFLFPMPVLIIASYDEDGTPNAMNAAWGSAADINRIAIYVSQGHKTMKNILSRGAFTVSMADEKNAVEADYVGIVSGNSVPDKFSRCGWHATKSERVDAPIIDELPMALECRLVSYDTESELLIGEIINVLADESVLTDGKIDPAKLKPICYDPVNHAYLALGEKIANAFEDGKKIK
ncbi:MAG: flavin reductase family protein [Ruminococcaceae bacterium]|nr:flavin reductase family protein [Oscillospiraceae bacterium]